MSGSCHLYEVVSHISGEHHVSQQPRVVAGGQTDLYQPLSVAEHLELRQRHVFGHLHGVVPAVPGVLQVRHGVAEALDLNGAHLGVEGEVCEVHGTGGLDGQPDAPQYLSSVHDPEELVLCGGTVEQGDLLIHKESVRNPDKFDVLRSNNWNTPLLYISIWSIGGKLNY